MHNAFNENKALLQARNTLSPGYSFQRGLAPCLAECAPPVPEQTCVVKFAAFPCKGKISLNFAVDSPSAETVLFQSASCKGIAVNQAKSKNALPPQLQAALLR